MKERLEEELSKLSIEAQTLVSTREDLHHRLREIDIRLTQIAGAMSSISSIIKESE
jgi:hypothetical protein